MRLIGFTRLSFFGLALAGIAMLTVGCASKPQYQTAATRLMYTFRMDGVQVDHRSATNLLYGTEIIKRAPKNLEYGDDGSFSHVSPTELSNGGRIKFHSARFIDQPTTEHEWDDFVVECVMQPPLQNFQYVIQENNQLVKVKLGENQAIVIQEHPDESVITPPRQEMAYIVCR